MTTAKQKSAPAAVPADPATPGLRALGRYRVTVQGAPVRVTDDQGRAVMQPHLDVDAVSPGDAFDRWKRHQGCLGTTAETKVELIARE